MELLGPCPGKISLVTLREVARYDTPIPDAELDLFATLRM
jgi:hypothetical protein